MRNAAETPGAGEVSNAGFRVEGKGPHADAAKIFDVLDGRNKKRMTLPLEGTPL